MVHQCLMSDVLTQNVRNTRNDKNARKPQELGGLSRMTKSKWRWSGGIRLNSKKIKTNIKSKGQSEMQSGDYPHRFPMLLFLLPLSIPLIPSSLTKLQAEGEGEGNEINGCRSLSKESGIISIQSTISTRDDVCATITYTALSESKGPSSKDKLGEGIQAWSKSGMT